MSSLNILFFLRAKNFDRLFEAVLDELLRRGHTVHVAFEVEKKPKLRNSRFVDSTVFDKLAHRHDGRLTYGPAPTQADPQAAVIGRQLRLGVDYVRYLTPDYRNAVALRERARKRTWPRLVLLANSAPARRPRGRALLDRTLRAAVDQLPLDPATLSFIGARAPDLVMVSPLVELGATQERHIRAARALGVPSAVLVASWDNLTNKGVILEVPDLVTVWNSAQKDEATRLHRIPASRVVATGAPPYDQWFGFKPTLSAEDFRAHVGLHQGRPYILYACSSRFIARDEDDFVRDWLRRLRASGHAALDDVGVLIRPHPANWHIWSESDLVDPGRVAIYPPEGEVPRSDESRADYFNSIHHARAVVGINTSAIVETAIIGRPAFTVLVDRYRGTQDGTLHFEHVDARRGGPLNIGHDYAEHFSQLAQTLGDEGPVEQLRSFVVRFVRPLGLDEPAAPRVAAELEALVRRRGRAPAASPAPLAAVRPRRMLWVLDHPGLLMHFDDTLAVLAERGHDVRVAFGRPARHAEALVALRGAACQETPVPRRRGLITIVAKQIRGALDALHYLDPQFDQATFARGRWAEGRSAPTWMRELAPLLTSSPAARELLRTALLRAQSALPVDRRVDRWLAGQSPDLVVVSPLVQRDPHQADVIAAARARGIPTLLAVASWDNLSSKGNLREIPDHVTVWNERQRHEASTLHRVEPHRLTITGAQPFDRWFGRCPESSREQFCISAGLGSDQPYVLWVGSTLQYRAKDDEIEFVRSWVRALRAAADQQTRDLGVIIRPHPTTLDVWADVDVPGAVIWRRRRALPITPNDRQAYFDALHHAAAVVGINSSAMVEAAIVGRPVHSIRRPEWAPMQDALLHFRHLVPENGGFLRIAASLDEHLRLLADDLRSPDAWAAAQERFVLDFVRPFGLDVPATPRLVAALEHAASRASARGSSTAVGEAPHDGGSDPSADGTSAARSSISLMRTLSSFTRSLSSRLRAAASA